MFKNKYKYIGTIINNKAMYDMSSTPTGLDILRRLMALKQPSQKQELKINIQKMTKGWGRL
jgi:hypothetical protein